MKTQLVIFGLTGDLGRRKLLPAIEHILEEGLVNPNDLSIIGISRRAIDKNQILESTFGKNYQKTKVSDILSFHTMDLENLDHYKQLKTILNKIKDSQKLLYLSVPPTSAAKISELAGQAKINDHQTTIMFEKPFGIDLESAEDFLQATHQYFSEKQIMRVDHYLGKKTVRDITSALEKNNILKGYLNSKQILKVQIVGTEKIDIEGRGIFYEQTGALRDLIQGHLMEVLATLISKTGKDSKSIKQARIEAMESLQSIVDVDQQAYRAQYVNYREEANSPKSTIETFAKVRLYSTFDDLKNIPFELISGKALKNKQTEIIFHLAKGKTISLNLLESSEDRPPYSQVFIDTIKKKSDFFVDSREIIASWKIHDEILKDWSFRGEQGLEFYQKGVDWQVLPKLAE